MHSQFLRGKLPNVIKTNFTRRSINSLATKSAVNTGFLKSALSLFSQKITLPSYTPKRTLVSYVELKGLHPNLKAKAPYSPLHGAEFIVTGALERLYDFALAELGNKAKEPSATSQLVTALFYRQGEQFRPTQNKSYPAYSLTPKRIAKLLHYLHQGTLDTAEARYALCAEWRKENISMTKLNKFLDCVSASQKESIAKQYLSQNSILF